VLIRPVSTAVTDVTKSVSKNKVSQGPENTSFRNVFEQLYGAVETLDQELVASQIDLVTGNARDMHTAILSAEKASLALDLVIAVRNKAIEAYQEIMRMPL